MSSVTETVGSRSQTINCLNNFLVDTNLKYVFHSQGLMKYDSDLQMELLKNQEIDFKVREIQAKDDAPETYVKESGIVSTNNEALSSSDVEDMELIDRKIKDLNEQLNYWKDRKRKCERKQVTNSQKLKGTNVNNDKVTNSDKEYRKHESQKSFKNLTTCDNLKGANVSNQNVKISEKEYRINESEKSFKNLTTCDNFKGANVSNQKVTISEKEYDKPESKKSVKKGQRRNVNEYFSSIQESKQKLLNDIRNSPEMEYSDFNRSDENLEFGIGERLKVSRNTNLKNIKKNVVHADYSDLNDSDEEVDSKIAKRKKTLMEKTKFVKFRENHGSKDYWDENESDDKLETNKLPKRKRNPDNSRKRSATKIPKRRSHAQSSDEENDKVSEKQTTLKSQEHSDIPTYEQEDYSNRESWRKIAARKVVEISSDENSQSSDNEQLPPYMKKLPMRNKGKKKCAKVIPKLPTLLDDDEISERNSDIELLNYPSDEQDDESLPDIPPDSPVQPVGDGNQPFLDHHGNMILPPLLQEFIDGQEGRSFTGWDRAADFQMLNLLKVMPKSEFAANKWQWVASQMENYNFSNAQISNHVSNFEILQTLRMTSHYPQIGQISFRCAL